MSKQQAKYLVEMYSKLLEQAALSLIIKAYSHLFLI